MSRRLSLQIAVLLLICSVSFSQTKIVTPSGGSRQTASFFNESTALGVSSIFQVRGTGNVGLEWICQETGPFHVGDTIHLELWAIGDDSNTATIQSVELIFEWDPSVQLVGLEHDDVFPYFISRFRLPGGPCALNEADPPADGDGLYSWFYNPLITPPLTIGSAGAHLTTFVFDVVMGAPDVVSIRMNESYSTEAKTDCVTEVVSNTGNLPLYLDEYTFDVLCISSEQCDNGNPCTTHECNTSGMCEYTPVEDGTDCADDFFCNGEEACLAGECVSEELPCQEAMYPYCDEETDSCVECLQDAHCADGDFCNGDEVCDQGSCKDGSDPCVDLDHCDEDADYCIECLEDQDCDDGNPCTSEFCQEQECVFENVSDETPCPDGEFCNGEEVCLAGICSVQADPCVDMDHCDEVADECWECIADVECDDGNPCTTNSCQDHVCVTVNLSDETSCSDDLFCNGEEICIQGLCEDQPDPCLDMDHCNEDGDFCFECLSDGECDDGNPCTENSCVNYVCVSENLPIGTSCENGLWCDGREICYQGTCLIGTKPCRSLEYCDEENDVCYECLYDGDCDDHNSCTTGSCIDKVCEHMPVDDGTPCLNDSFCDGQEECQAGVCSDQADPCADEEHCDEDGDVCYECVVDAECDDGNPCTSDTCIDHACDNAILEDGTTCDDGDFCNGLETCESGFCLDREDPCIDLDHCDEVGDVCFECVADAECNDGNPCTDDSCIDHVCERLPVDDGIPCLDDLFCNGQEECQAGICEDRADPCIDGNHCDEDGDVCYECISDAECDDINLCTDDACVDHSCSSVPVEDGTPCLDELFCNGPEECIGGSCTDRPDPCVDEEHCDEGGDVCYECVADAECDDGNPCTDDSCIDHVCERIPVDDGTPCLDELFCNGPEECIGGSCTDRPDPCVDEEHCDEGGDVCYECISDAECEDSNPCTDDACIDHSCSSVPVEDGTPCLDDLFCNGQEECRAGNCEDQPDPCIDDEHCDDVGDVCYECVADAECDDGNPCTDDACVDYACDSVPVDDGLPCPDENFCNGEETCVDGACSDQADPCIDVDHCDEAEDVCYECVADAECDDDRFCTGEESCIDYLCVSAGNPCDEPGLTCIEELDECVSPPYISHIYQDNGAVRSMASNVNPDGPASIQARLAGMTTCTIQFSEDVVVGPEDILIRDVDDLTDEPFPSGFEYDSESYSLTMTWADNTFRNQWVRIHVLDSVKSAVTRVSLDGEIFMPSARSSGLALNGSVPSGDGIPGGDSQFVLGSLVGDVNGNGIVNVTDRGVLQYNIGKVCPEGDLPSDINGNCIINVTDRGIIQSNIGATLPALPLP